MGKKPISYSSIYSIKDFAANELAPKYFNMKETNDLNIGLLGYVTELASVPTEDAFNTISLLMNEMFPNLAMLPESIYSYAALFHIQDIFATPSELDCLIFVSEDDVMKYATRVNDSSASTSDEDLFEFYIDSKSIIHVGEIPFLMDYDIRVTYKPYRGDFVFAAQYYTRKYGAKFKNSVSPITNPHIKIKRFRYENQKYLMMLVKTHQLTRFTRNENIVTNDVINLPTFTVDFDGELANFEVFYRDPNSSTFVQLQKRMNGTVPLKEPFCFYRFKDENKIEITFSSRDNYFQPKFNSELYIDWYTTTGAKGNFPRYTGNDVTVTPGSEEFEYNNDVVLFAVPQSDAQFGANKLSLEQLRIQVIEKFSTVNSYTNENDLQLYFDKFNSLYNADVVFIKKRDDTFLRLFTSFTRFKKTDGDIFHTNTLKLKTDTKQFDIENSQSKSYLLKPGHLYAYEDDSTLDTVTQQAKLLKDDFSDIRKDFLYTNPFLIYFGKDPSVLGYYLNTVDSTYVVDYKELNDKSLVQFIVGNMVVKRSAITGEDKYTISVQITPTTELDAPIVTEEKDKVTGEVTRVNYHNTLVLRLAVEDNGAEIAFTDFKLKEYDLKSNIYTYECTIDTDDYININNKMRTTNLFTPNSTHTSYEKESRLIPMVDCVLNIHAYYRPKENGPVPEITDQNAPRDLEKFIKTNTYSTMTNKVTFIYPIRMMRSNTKFVYNGDGTIGPGGTIQGGTYHLAIDSFPLVEANTMKNPKFAKEFYELLSDQYNHLFKIIAHITNNFSVDMKFFNTYGRSKNFLIGDNQDRLLDRVNIKLKFLIKPIFGVDHEELIRDLKIHIKKYVETVNEGGTNALYISNLIQSIENTFRSVDYLKFVSINDHPSSVQAIENKAANLNDLTKEERFSYVPEYLTIGIDDIILEIF